MLTPGDHQVKLFSKRQSNLQYFFGGQIEGTLVENPRSETSAFLCNILKFERVRQIIQGYHQRQAITEAGEKKMQHYSWFRKMFLAQRMEKGSIKEKKSHGSKQINE